MKNLIYSLSLLLIGTSIFFLLEYPNSGRMSLIAGVMIFLGFISNIASFAMNKNKIASPKK